MCQTGFTKRTALWRSFAAPIGLLAIIAISSSSPAHAGPGWQYMLTGTEFSDYTAFEAAYNYNYPWGTDHNGSARMYGSSTDHTNLYIGPAGQLNFMAAPCAPEGNSTSDPYLPIHYHSGTCFAKSQITISSQYTNYIIQGDFQVPTVKGTWPAFWITAVNTWPPESDIMEFKGDPFCSQNTANGLYPNVTWNTHRTRVGSASTAWHTYKLTMDLIPGTSDVTLKYYIDGNLHGTDTGHGWLNAPFWMILDLQMEGSSGSPGPTTPVYYHAKNVIVQRYSTQ